MQFAYITKYLTYFQLVELNKRNIGYKEQGYNNFRIKYVSLKSATYQDQAFLNADKVWTFQCQEYEQQRHGFRQSFLRH
jgi:hypothetical protein